MQWEERIGRRLKLRDLHTLQIVSEIGSMAKASQRLGLSQPAISKAIAEMEHALGAPLLERSATDVELTPCGSMLVERARVIFDEVRQGVREIEHASDPRRGADRRHRAAHGHPGRDHQWAFLTISQDHLQYNH